MLRFTMLVFFVLSLGSIGSTAFANQAKAEVILDEIQDLARGSSDQIQIKDCMVTIQSPHGPPFDRDVWRTRVNFNLKEVEKIDIRPRPNEDASQEFLLFQLGAQFSAVVEERSSVVIEHLLNGTAASRDFTLSDFTLFSKPNSTSRAAIFLFKKPSQISDERVFDQLVVNELIFGKILLYAALACY